MKILNSVQREQSALILAYPVRPWTLQETIIARVSARHLTAINEWFSMLPRLPLFSEYFGLTAEDLLANPDLRPEFVTKIKAVMDGDLTQLKELHDSYPMVRRNWLESLSRQGKLDKLVSFATIQGDAEVLYQRCRAMYLELSQIVEKFPVTKTPYFVQGQINLSIRAFQTYAIENKDEKYFGLTLPSAVSASFNRVLSGWGHSTLLNLIATYELYKVSDFIEELNTPPLIIEVLPQGLPLKCYPARGQGWHEVMYFKQGNRHFHSVV